MTTAEMAEDKFAQSQVTDRSGCCFAVDASPVLVLEGDMCGVEETVMPVTNGNKSKLANWAPSLDPSVVVSLVRDFNNATTPCAQVEAALSYVSPNDEAFNDVVLAKVAAAWIDLHDSVDEAHRYKKSFLLELEAEWPEKNPAPAFLRAVQKRIKEEPTRNSRLLADAALLVILKTKYKNQPVKVSLPAYLNSLEA